MARIAFFANEGTFDKETNTYFVGMAEEHSPGYVVHNQGWTTLAKARAYAEDRNAERGLTVDDTLAIIASSMGAGRVAN